MLSKKGNSVLKALRALTTVAMILSMTLSVMASSACDKKKEGLSVNNHYHAELIIFHGKYTDYEGCELCKIPPTRFIYTGCIYSTSYFTLGQYPPSEHFPITYYSGNNEKVLFYEGYKFKVKDLDNNERVVLQPL